MPIWLIAVIVAGVLLAVYLLFRGSPTADRQEGRTKRKCLRQAKWAAGCSPLQLFKRCDSKRYGQLARGCK